MSSLDGCSVAIGGVALNADGRLKDQRGTNDVVASICKGHALEFYLHDRQSIHVVNPTEFSVCVKGVLGSQVHC